MDYSVYIHIPFCTKKCCYCDFFSVSEPSSHEAYVTSLLKELAQADFHGKIDTLYIGGGTPTELPVRMLSSIMDFAGELPLEINAEFTVEANPGNLNQEKLSLLKNGGVNRLSIGLQSSHRPLLLTLGRTHTYEDFEANFHDARKTGFDNINVDLMFALPRQTMNMWKDTLKTVVALEPEHLSTYSLTPGRNTPLWASIQSGEIVLPDDEEDRAMYHYAREFLAKEGYVHYEISNFAKPGFESRHNVNCWKLIPFYGFGAGAHSFDGVRRWQNEQNLGAYIKRAGALDGQGPVMGSEQSQEISEDTIKELMSDAMILGLRLTEGVEESRPIAAAGISPDAWFKSQIDGLVTKGLLERSSGKIRLTDMGLDLANRVFGEFV